MKADKAECDVEGILLPILCVYDQSQGVQHQTYVNILYFIIKRPKHNKKYKI